MGELEHRAFSASSVSRSSFRRPPLLGRLRRARYRARSVQASASNDPGTRDSVRAPSSRRRHPRLRCPRVSQRDPRVAGLPWCYGRARGVAPERSRRAASSALGELVSLEEAQRRVAFEILDPESLPEPSPTPMPTARRRGGSRRPPRIGARMARSGWSPSPSSAATWCSNPPSVSSSAPGRQRGGRLRQGRRRGLFLSGEPQASSRSGIPRPARSGRRR